MYEEKIARLNEVKHRLNFTSKKRRLREVIQIRLLLNLTEIVTDNQKVLIK